MMRKSYFVFMIFCLLFLSSCQAASGEISVDEIRNVKSLYGTTNLDSGAIVRRQTSQRLIEYLGEPYEKYISDDGLIREYHYKIEGLDGHTVVFSYFNFEIIHPLRYFEVLVGISLQKDGVPYYNRSATVLSGGADSTHYSGSTLTFAEIEWYAFWDEIADKVGKEEMVCLDIFTEQNSVSEEQNSDSEDVHPYFDKIFFGEEFFDVQFFLGKPENLTRMGLLGFIAEYPLSSDSRLDLFFAYDEIALPTEAPDGSDVYSAKLSMAFLCSDAFEDPYYERVFFNDDYFEDNSLDISTTKPWGLDGRVNEQVIHLYTNVYEVHNAFGPPDSTLYYPNTIIYIYENDWGDILYYVMQKGDSGLTAFSSNTTSLLAAELEILTGKNCDLSIDEIRESDFFTELESASGRIKFQAQFRLHYVYSKLGLPAHACRLLSPRSTHIVYVCDGEIIFIYD